MKHDETRGLYLRGQYYWLQLPMVNGIRPKPITLQTTDLTEAITRAMEVRTNPVMTPASGLITELEHFLIYKSQRKNYSASTRKAKFYVVRSFIDWLPRHASVQSVTTEQVQQYYDRLLGKFSAATAHKALMDIRAWFRWELEVEKKVRRNPVIGVRAEPVPDAPRVRFCTKEQRDKLINECPREDLKLVLMLGFHAGLRKQEIIQAVPRWFHLSERSLDLCATPTMPFNRYKKPRTIPMRQVLFDFLQSYGLREPFMLRPEVKKGKDIYRYDFDVVLKNYVKAQKLPWVTAHVMRHTFASLLVQDGTSIFKVAKWLGDTVRVTEKHYAHLAPKDDDIEERPRIKSRGRKGTPRH
ncbi:MAG: hypothetical protein QOE70_1401 [Chthoniobacter sp.]|jgi:integrase|nr:hypothetical protein [Chthoniobacter sp.]